MTAKKQALSSGCVSYRVYYQYTDGDTTRPRKYSIVVNNAENAEAAEAIVRAVMVRDGMPMDHIEITGATPNALT